MYYRYNVLAETGAEIIGIEEGPYSDIKKRLLEKKCHILSIEPDFISSLKSALEKKRIKSRALSALFRDLANMLKRGLNINEAISCLEGSSYDAVLLEVLEQINAELSNGPSLAEAFQKTKCFPWQVLNTLKVGEKSGDLERVFNELSKYYCRQAEFAVSLKNAVFYPLVVFCFLIGIMFYVSFKVLPHLEGLVSTGQNAYFATKALLFLAHSFKEFFLLLFIFPLALVVIHKKLKSSSLKQIASFYYRIPVIGAVLKDIAFSMLFSNLAVLQRNGISISDGLALICEAAPYKFLADKFLNLKECILGGSSFWLALKKDAFFPKAVYYQVKKGEETGRLDEALEEISEDYYKKVTGELSFLLSLVQPALLVLCAGFLLLIILAFIVPVYSNLSNIASGNVKF